MNKASLVLATEEITGQGITDTTKAVDAMLRVLVHTLASGEKVSITGLGSLEPVIRDERPARNPQTGEPITVPERIEIKWRPADRLLDLANDRIPLPKQAADVDLKALPAPAQAATA